MGEGRGKKVLETSKRAALTIWAREDTDLDLAELVNEVQFGEAEQPGWRMDWFLNWQELEKWGNKRDKQVYSSGLHLQSGCPEEL